MNVTRKILIIDDSQTVLDMTKALFESEGYVAVTAIDGLKGVQATDREKPDIVFVDTILPDIDGFEVTRRIREAHGPDNPKIVVMTGSIDAIDAVKAKRMGADDYRVKTGDLMPLKEAVDEFFKNEADK